jgi:hypothetical protein
MQKIKNYLESLGYTVTLYGSRLHATSKSLLINKYVTIERGETYTISFAEAINGIVRQKHYECKNYKEVIDSIKN